LVIAYRQEADLWNTITSKVNYVYIYSSIVLADLVNPRKSRK
jgi:hypothetical protein